MCQSESLKGRLLKFQSGAGQISLRRPAEVRIDCDDARIGTWTRMKRAWVAMDAPTKAAIVARRPSRLIDSDQNEREAEAEPAGSRKPLLLLRSADGLQ